MAEMLFVLVCLLCVVFGYLAGRADERRRYRLRGSYLTKMANVFGVRRFDGERDEALRERLHHIAFPGMMRRAPRDARDRFVGESESAFEARRKGGFR